MESASPRSGNRPLAMLLGSIMTQVTGSHVAATGARSRLTLQAFHG